MTNPNPPRPTMADPTYRPWSAIEADLTEMELDFLERSALWQRCAKEDRSEYAKMYRRWAIACGDAMKSNDALQQRYLEDTTTLKGEIGRLNAELLRQRAGRAA